MKKSRLATAAVAAVVVGTIGFSVPAFGASGYGAVNVEKTDSVVTIGNDALSRTFSIKGNKLKPGKIDNKLAGDVSFVPGEGSEEFTIGLMPAGNRVEPGDNALTSVKPSKASTTATAKGSSVNEGEGATADKAIDGDSKGANSYWASNEHDAGTANIEIDFGSKKTVKRVDYFARRNGQDNTYNSTGTIHKYKLEYHNGSEWVEVKTGAFANIASTGKGVIELESPVETQKIRLTAVESYHWQDANKNKYASAAEIDAFDSSGVSVIRGASAWKAEVSSSSTSGDDAGGADALIDGDANTYWHSNYGEGTGEPNKLPVTATIDRGGSKDAFQTVGYLPRSTSANGNWQEFELYASDDEKDLFSEKNKQKSSAGATTFKVLYNGMYGEGDQAGAKMIYFGLEKEINTRYVGFKVLKGQGGNFAAGAEIDLFSGEAFTSYPDADATEIKASDLTIEKVVESDAQGDGGKMLTFDFAPFTYGTDSSADIEMKVVMDDNDHYMRKWIELETSDTTTRISYIDGEHLETESAKQTWTVPSDKSIVQMEPAKAILGQPVYIDGMFFGSEFPETDTQIVDGLGRSRYWTGKNFADFQRDNQLTKDGEYVSWQTVCGATHDDGDDKNVVQADFFDYIDDIAKPSDFRIQYNSWFDNMMFIDDENIIESFKEVDKELSETGVRPLESYVVDDGWNNYRPAEGQLMGPDDVRRNGEGVNTDGFWTFNSKFPDGLTPSSSLVKKLGSNFGVWVGPRGGYNYYGQLAGIMANAGKGSEAGGSIDVADQRYVTNFKDMAIDWMKQYDVNYWKWDGFADKAQYNAFKKGDRVAGYDASHQHMYGGPNGYFHSTDLWEKWIVLFDEVWKTADEEQIKDLWVSLTCYVNPSPWFLQWSNSVWIQCVGDRGEVHGGAGDDKMNTMLTYRDACYYEFINSNQFQFPLANVYNHDPIYGKEGTGINADSMNGEQFRNYLFMQGTRGTAFWELYYSDSLFNDEKYLINADFLKWEEENFEMLRNAKWIGGDPASEAGLSSGNILSNPGTQEAYGFSGFNASGNEGIISMRNPANSERTIKFKLDDAVGCTEEGTYKVVLDHVYTQNGNKAAQAPSSISKGESVEIKLQPGETQIWHISKKGDTVAPKLEKLYAENNTTLRVQASEHVYNATFEVTVNGKKVDATAKAYADLKTFDLKLAKAYADGDKVEVKALTGADSAGNRIEGTASRVAYTDGVVVSADSIAGTAISSAKRSVEGKNGFAVAATVEAVVPGATVAQGSEWSLSINNDGKAAFTVNGVTAVSDAEVKELSTITGVRENNGMLKVYVNGEISGNGYDAKKTLGYNVKAADITVSDAAAFSSVKVYDKSLGYDEVPASPLADLIKTVEGVKDRVTGDSWTKAGMDSLITAAKEALKSDAAAQKVAYDNLLKGYKSLVPGQSSVEASNIAKGVSPTASWLPGSERTDAADNAGSPLAKATDGISNSCTNGEFAIFGKDDAHEPAYMQIDLGAESVIDNVTLWRYWTDKRSYADTALVVSNDANFENKQVLYYSHEGAEKDLFNLGVEATESLYTETPEGKKLFTANGKTVTARYVRLYGSGKVGGSKGDNHVIELQVNGYKKANLKDPYGMDKLEALIADAEKAVADSGKYTEASIANVKTALDALKPMVEKIKAEQATGNYTQSLGAVSDARATLELAIKQLETRPVTPPAPDQGDDKVTVEKHPDGSQTVTTKGDDGSKTVVEIDKSGKVTSVDATVSQDAAKDGSATLPMEGLEQTSSKNAPTIKVDVPVSVSKDDPLAITVPVAKAKGEKTVDPGLVVVKVDKDGKQTVLPKTAFGADGVTVEVDGDCEIKVVDAAKTFPDVKDSDWFAAEVVPFATARGILNGVAAPDGSREFQGDGETSRAMFVAMLSNLELGPKAQSGSSFADVPGDAWYANAAAWAAENDLVEGKGGTSFDGEGEVTREQIAVFLMRYADFLGLDTSARTDVDFPDADEVSEWAREAMSWAVAEGLFTGNGVTGELDPASGATRAETATVLMRFINQMYA
ncbi:discoidin domain-containing protein [Collinsella tanakaei]|uniref:discoidin domain-containing protein n=1 Tax=Collinsella tanakaei TaxID=626935 RepID=UPI0026EAD5BA|nr:discoidin domain-containing protein [Collinsella tanakaei]